MFVMSIASLGRTAEALEWIRRLEAGGDGATALVAAARLLDRGARRRGRRHPPYVCGIGPRSEAEYYAARHLAHIGAPDVALPILQRAVEGGYFCYPAMAGDPWLDSLRGQPLFHDVLARARAGCGAAAAAFVAAGGDAVLGVAMSP